MDFLLYVILLLIGGCFSGLMAGLLGVGGGVILSPIQYALLLAMGVKPEIALPMAFATSLAVILVTMINSTRKHYQNGLVEVRYLKILMILGVLGSVIGAFISTHVNVDILKVIFGIVCLFSVVNMVVIKYPDNDDNINKSKLAHGLLGLVAGLLCGLMGVGGGIVMIPALTILLKYPTHKAVGTSSAAIIATSTGGLIAYIILGQSVVGLPPYSLGYVNLLQFVFLTITSTIVAGYAANLSKNVDARILKALQIIIVAYIGFKMIGLV